MFQKPRAAKRLYFDVIPRAVDDYLTFVEKFANEAPAQRLENPVWHIHNGQPPQLSLDLSYGILLNLASVANAEEKAQLWGFITRYRPDATPQTAPFLDRLVGYAINYYRDFVKPTKRYRAPNEIERAALAELLAYLETRAGECRCRDPPDRGLRDRQAPSVPRAARLVQGALRSAAGPGPGAALRLLHRALRAQGDGGI